MAKTYHIGLCLAQRCIGADLLIGQIGLFDYPGLQDLGYPLLLGMYRFAFLLRLYKRIPGNRCDEPSAFSSRLPQETQVSRVNYVE